MIRAISKTSHLTYKHVTKPILFRFKPDDVHNNLLKHGTRLQRSALIRSGLKHAWAYHNDTFLKQDILGITFHNPIGLSAGFDKNFELAPMLKAIGFGFMEGGSLTFHECVGNPRPWFHRLPQTQSLVVYAGLANQGVRKIITRLQSYPPDTFLNFPLNISVAKTNSKQTCTDTEAIADYTGSLKLLKKAGLGDMYTLNISCPNTYGGEPFTTPERLNKLLHAVDKLKLPQPVFIKMPSHLPWEQFKALLDVADKHTIHGVTISNLAKDRGQVKLMDLLPDTIKGNLSGKPTWDLSNELIKRTYQAFHDRFIIIGVGGIFSADDAYEKIRLGASLVELITGMIFNGPQLIGQINHGLVQLLERDGYSHISQAIGAAVQKPKRTK